MNADEKSEIDVLVDRREMEGVLWAKALLRTHYEDKFPDEGEINELSVWFAAAIYAGRRKILDKSAPSSADMAALKARMKARHDAKENDMEPTTNHERKLIDELVKKKSVNSREWAEALMNGHFSISKETTQDDLDHVRAFFISAMMVAMDVAYEKAAEGKRKTESDVTEERATPRPGSRWPVPRASEPEYLTTPDGFADFTDDAPARQARINDLEKATEIYKRIKSQGILGTNSPMAVSEIIILAEYIRKGSEKP